jgi:hypothetical protein
MRAFFCEENWPNFESDGKNRIAPSAMRAYKVFGILRVEYRDARVSAVSQTRLDWKSFAASL